MSKFHIVVTDDRYGSYAEEEAVLQNIDAELYICSGDREDEVVNAVQNADGVLLNLFTLTSKIVEKMIKCKIISRYGVGYDNVDISAATKAGIWVANVPDYSIEDVSDQSVALLLGCIRKVAYKDRNIRQGSWNLHKDQPIHRTKGRILGLIGYGAIARAFRRKVSGLALAKVLVYDPYIKPEIIRNENAIPADLHNLLKESDYVSVHVPLNEKTRGMIGKTEFSNMKNDVILVNTSRGAVLDEKALCAALKSGEIGYAGLDVFEQEPLSSESPLKNFDNVILSDHCGWYSEESLKELKTKSAQNILEVLKGKKPLYPVNEISQLRR